MHFCVVLPEELVDDKVQVRDLLLSNGLIWGLKDPRSATKCRQLLQFCLAMERQPNNFQASALLSLCDDFPSRRESREADLTEANTLSRHVPDTFPARIFPLVFAFQTIFVVVFLGPGEF